MSTIPWTKSGRRAARADKAPPPGSSELSRVRVSE